MTIEANMQVTAIQAGEHQCYMPREERSNYTLNRFQATCGKTSTEA